MGFDRHATSEHLLKAVLERLCEAGHDVHIIQRVTGGELPHVPASVAGYSVTSDAIPFKEPEKSNFAARYLAELKYVTDSRKYMHGDYDAVFIQSNNAAGFAVYTVRKKAPKALVTFNVQDIFPDNAVYSGSIKKNGLIDRVMSAEQRYSYTHSDRLITISEDMKETLEEDGASGDRVSVIYNWSYSDEPYSDLEPLPDIFDDDRFNVVYAGNIGVMQNVDIVIEAARLLKEDPQIKFHIIGDGVYKEKLEKRAEEYGLENIAFWPMQPPELAPRIYSAASVNVIPLVRNIYRTALPSKTAVCFASGKPVIFAVGKDSMFAGRAMAECGCPVVESDDSEGLASAIKDIRDNKIKTVSDSFFRKHFLLSVNSRKYADIITAKEEDR